MQHRRGSDKAFTILCIDDESMNLKVLASLFKDIYQVAVCKFPLQALEKVREIMPDLILLDVVMPEKDGFELINELKADTNLAHIPVIFITGLQDPMDEEKGLRLGACDYIHKPFNSSVVRARVHTHLELLRQRNLLEQYANIDTLTEVPNRRKWQQDVDQFFQSNSGQDVCIGIIDIDYFKTYNDTYGHQQGDIALRKVAKAVERVLYEDGGRIYRCGGEEFYFYVPLGRKDSLSVVERCLQVVRTMEIAHEGSLCSDCVTISLGSVMHVVSEDSDPEDVLANADQVLYEVKQGGRNSFKVK